MNQTVESPGFKTLKDYTKKKLKKIRTNSMNIANKIFT